MVYIVGTVVDMYYMQVSSTIINSIKINSILMLTPHLYPGIACIFILLQLSIVSSFDFHARTYHIYHQISSYYPIVIMLRSDMELWKLFQHRYLLPMILVLGEKSCWWDIVFKWKMNTMYKSICNLMLLTLLPPSKFKLGQPPISIKYQCK